MGILRQLGKKKDHRDFTQSISGFPHAFATTFFKNCFSVQNSGYTLAYDPPSDPAKVFAPSVTVEELQNYMGPDNPPMYISSVTYGRILIFKMTSRRSYEDIKAAMKWKVLGIGSEDSLRHKRILTESELQVLVLGGNASQGVLPILGNDVKSYIQQGANWSADSPGVPIAYTTKYLKNHQVAKLGYTTEFEVWECQLGTQLIKVTFHNIEVISDCDGGFNGKGEFYYEFKVDNQVVAAVSKENHVSRNGGEWIEITQSTFLRRFTRRGEGFTVSGWVREGDGDTIADDEYVGDFAHRFLFEDNRWNPGRHDTGDKLQKNGGCHVRLYYEVELLKGQETSD